MYRHLKKYNRLKTKLNMTEIPYIYISFSQYIPVKIKLYSTFFMFLFTIHAVLSIISNNFFETNKKKSTNEFYNQSVD